jgi:[ribosomal protein S5]-alanine N-acetyltransferase
MLETKRLLIKPLTYNQLVKYIKADNSLEEELQLNSTARVVSEILKQKMTLNILPKLADATINYLYVTLWTAINKDEKCMVCDVCFKGEPNAEGEIEIGYGTQPQFQGKGYMKEAVGGMITWAKSQPNVKSIFAETLKDNSASYTILERNKFIKVGETAMYFQWRLTW